MRTAATKTLPELPKREPVNLMLDPELTQTVKDYIKQNRKAGCMSDIVEDDLIRLIARKGRKYGLRVPKHLM